METFNPGVTVVIAAYNRGTKIADTIESVLDQRLKPNEIILVDDGSTDTTAHFVTHAFPSVRVLLKPNGGTSSARNFGAQHARFDRLVFLDHDDLLHPYAIETLSRLLDSCPLASAAFCDHSYADLTNAIQHDNHHKALPAFARLAEIPYQKTGESAFRLFGRPMYLALLLGNLLQQPYMVWKWAFLTAGGYREPIRYCEDWDFYLRLTRRHFIVLSDAVISTHRIEGMNLHLADWKKQYEMYLNVLSHQLLERHDLSLRDVQVVKRRIGSMHKDLGDSAMAAKDFETARQRYADSFRAWPFDHVVAARLVLWHPAVRSFMRMARAAGLRR